MHSIKAGMQARSPSQDFRMHVCVTFPPHPPFLGGFCRVCLPAVGDVCVRGSMGEKEGGPPPIHICLPGITSAGLEKVGERDGGGGYSLSVKQEVAQHLFHGISEGSERQTAACLGVRLRAARCTSLRTTGRRQNLVALKGPSTFRQTDRQMERQTQTDRLLH